jgi:hypothetical protein
MPNDSSAIVQKVLNYAHVLKNAGVGYGDSVEVRAARAWISYLLFLKLAPPSPGLRRAGEFEWSGARGTIWMDCEIVQQAVARFLWSSNLALLKKLATEPKPPSAA